MVEFKFNIYIYRQWNNPYEIEVEFSKMVFVNSITFN